MSYDYTACERSRECLFGLGALGKIKILLQTLIVKSSGASLWVVKITCGNWYRLLWCRDKVISAPGKCTRSVKKSFIQKSIQSFLHYTGNENLFRVNAKDKQEFNKIPEMTGVNDEMSTKGEEGQIFKRALRKEAVGPLGLKISYRDVEKSFLFTEQ
ncbi:hypothetical protein TNCV_4084711 [Trichonephila clavipes]|nr:hypothetical protein TNCV_4084711 [Trichonephila clavipes]